MLATVEKMAPRKVKVRLLGGFEVAIDDRPVHPTAWRQRRGADLVKLLALSPGRRLAREQVAEALWPGADPSAASGNVRKAAFHARRSLGCYDGILLAGGSVQLFPDQDVVVDAATFTATAAQAHGHAEAARAAAALYSGDLLPDDLYAEWCRGERQRLRLMYIDMLTIGEQWGRLVDVDPANERAHLEIMRAHLANGDRRGALRRYELMRTALRDELGVLPGEVSVELYERALEMQGRDAPTPGDRARALLAWGVVHWERSDIEEAERTAAEARALAIDAGLGRELSEASELLGLIAYAQGAWQEVFADQFIETVVSTPDLTPFVLDAHMCMCEFALYETDGVDAMNNFSNRLIATATDIGSPQAKALGLLLRGEATLVSVDEPEAARSDLAASAQIHEDGESLTGAALALERLAQLEDRRGDRPAAETLHRRALDSARDSPVDRHLVPFIYGGLLEGCEPGAGSAIVLEAEAALEDVEVCDPCAMGLRVAAATHLARDGHLGAAERYLAQAERVAAMWAEGPWHAAVDEARSAVMLAGGGSREDSLDLLGRAAAGYAAASRPYDEARCLKLAADLAG